MEKVMVDFNDSIVMKRMETIRQDARIYHQQIWLDAVEYYEEYHFDPMPKEVAVFLSASFEAINEIGLLVENYTFTDLYIINSLLAAAACWGRNDLISEANISDEFIDSVEMALESQGVQFM